MARRRIALIIGLVVALALAGLVAGYLFGLVSFGDPFPGTWKQPGNPDVALVVRHTSAGYSFAMVVSGRTNGWLSATRNGNVLTSKARVLDPQGQPTGQVITTRFVFRPWSRHLIEDDPNVKGIAFDKVSDSTSAPPPTVQ